MRPEAPSSSLNLAQAVQVFCYELYKQYQDNGEMLSKGNTISAKKASGVEITSFYDHLETTMKDVGFLRPERPGHVMTRMKRLFQRAQLEVAEINILRGFLSRVGKNKRQ
ncbi:MAG: hypothetical protein ACO2ZM_06140 [Francisellaceae bacterium]